MNLFSLMQCYFDSSKLITDANGISIGVSFKDWHRQSIGFIPFRMPMPAHQIASMLFNFVLESN
jgi:hypothetical protein